jgi:hypothetical protein
MPAYVLSSFKVTLIPDLIRVKVYFFNVESYDWW